MSINTNFIRRYIKENHLTTYGFARKADITGPTMWRILHGQKTLKTNNLIKIIEAMHLDKSKIYRIFLFS